MAAITPADQSESTDQKPAENGKGETVSAPDRPRARLGETEVVQLHNSDSEDEGDEVTVPEDGDEEAFDDPDFLKDYPDDTTVSRGSNRYLALQCLMCTCVPSSGLASPALATSNRKFAGSAFPSIRKTPAATLSPSKQSYLATTGRSV